MRRRDFSSQLAAASLGLVSGPAAWAQRAYIEGQHYKRLGTPVPVQLPPGKKIDVVEFFSYACPHCFAFEPTLVGWVKTLPADVHFHPVPVAFVMGRTWVPKVFYALEAIGQREALHGKLFSAMHEQHLPLLTEADAVKWVLSTGVEAAPFTEALKSPAVSEQVRRAGHWLEAYQVDSVPLLGVQGRYTAPSAVEGSHAKALPLFTQLIQFARAAS